MKDISTYVYIHGHGLGGNGIISHPSALSCIVHCKQVLLTSTCPEFKHAEPFPYTELSPSEKKAYWEWKQRKIKDYSSLGL